MSRKKSVEGLPPFVIPRKVCRSCVAGKHHRTSFPKKSLVRAIEPLELIHIDICEPLTPTTLGGSYYFLLIIDEFSRLTWVSMLQCKSDAFEAFTHFKSLAETKKGVKVKTLKSDRGGGEFTSDEFINYCLEHGIKRQLTAPYSPQQNGVVERKNRTVVSMVRAMLKAKDLPRELWGEAVSTTVYILNRTSSKALQGQTPHEKWTRRKPSVDHLRTFGCIAHLKDTRRHQGKLEDRSKLMIFIGYQIGLKAYKCLDPVNLKVVINRDIIFKEAERWTWSTQGESSTPLTFLPIFSSDQGIEDQVESSDEEEEGSTEATSPSNGMESITSGEMESPRYKSLTDLYTETSPITQDEEAHLLTSEEPLSYTEVASEEVWMRAMREEMLAIDKNDTWELEIPPPNCRPIGLKWIFKVKKSPQGVIIKYKARLVVKGYSQRKGVDYDEIYAPVVRIETIRLLIALAALKDWQIHHLDVKSAFLNGEINEVIYVKKPEGFLVKGKEGYVLRLKKALYGLKQAPRAWYFKLHSCLLSLGFVKSEYEQSLYLKQTDANFLVVGVYVDDLLITGSSSSVIDDFKVEMTREFDMSNLGSLSSYLGIEVKQSKDFIFLSQTAYAQKVLQHAKLGHCNSAITPLESQAKFISEEGKSTVNSTTYHNLIGSLRYLTHTRPDILFAVGILSRHMENPTQEHYIGVKRVLRYLKGTENYGLFYKKGDFRGELIGYSDNDFAGDSNDRKSASGHIFFLGGMAVSWSSKKQIIVALSSCEAEYIAATSATCQAVWMSRLLGELMRNEAMKAKLLVDNQSAITLSKNPVHHNLTKHIHTRYHFVRQCVEDKKIEIEFVRSDDQLAGIFTKALGKAKFLEMRDRIGIRDTPMEELEHGGD